MVLRKSFGNKVAPRFRELNIVRLSLEDLKFNKPIARKAISV